MPDMEKYVGTEDPVLFIENYLLAMGPLGLNDHTLLKLFPRYLTDIASRWYIANDIASITSIKKLGNSFTERFAMNVKTDRPKKKLRHVKQEDNETFESFSERWRKTAAAMDTPPSEKQQIDLMIENLNSK